MNYAEFTEVMDINGWTLSRAVKHHLAGAIFYENKIKRAMSVTDEISVTSIKAFSEFKLKCIEEAFKIAKFEKELGTNIYDPNLNELIASVGRDNPELSKLLMINMELAKTYRQAQHREREYLSKDNEIKRLYDDVHGAVA